MISNCLYNYFPWPWLIHVSIHVKKFSTCMSLIMVVYELSVPDDNSNVLYVFIPLMPMVRNIVFKGTCSLLHRCNWDRGIVCLWCNRTWDSTLKFSSSCTRQCVEERRYILNHKVCKVNPKKNSFSHFHCPYVFSAHFHY